MQEKPSNTYKILEEARAVIDETRKVYEEGASQELEQRVFRPLFIVDYAAETQDVLQGDNQMRFVKTQLSEKDKALLERYIVSRSTDVKKDSGFLDKNKWYAVDQLSYKLGETRVDIFSYIPEGYKILFCPTSKVYNGAVDSQNKIIYVTSDISSLGSIATILHEVGHIKDDERLQKLGRTEFTEGGEYHENIEAEQIRKEREASLFALRKIWRELRKNSQTKKDILLYLKNMAYFSYCETGLGNISTARAIAHHNPYDLDLDMQEEFDRERFDAWEKFKESDEYQTWKEIVEFAKLDEFEEYGAWCKWIQVAGKVADPKFMSTYFGYED